MNFQTIYQKDIGYCLIKRVSYKAPKLSFHQLGYLQVRVPKNYTNRKILNFINSYRQWIKRHAKQNLYLSSKNSVMGVTINHKLTDSSVTPTIKVAKNEIIVKSSKMSYNSPKLQILLHKAISRNLVGLHKEYLLNKSTTLAEQLNLQPNKINIKDMSSRWGSCTKSGNISLSIYLIFLPDKLQNYVIIHELTHLLHHNHSSNFWSYLELIYPDVYESRQQIKIHTPRIFA